MQRPEWTAKVGRSTSRVRKLGWWNFTARFIGERTGQKPLKRDIPKADGRQRPLGVASLEDKIVQQAIGKRPKFPS